MMIHDDDDTLHDAYVSKFSVPLPPSALKLCPNSSFMSRSRLLLLHHQSSSSIIFIDQLH